MRYLVSRHPGTLAWANQIDHDGRKRVDYDKHLVQLCVDDVRKGDVVIGTLPINLASQVCARGAKYLHLALEVPLELRGVDLSAEQLEQLAARLTEYRVWELEVQL